MAEDKTGSAWLSLKWHDRTKYEGVVQDNRCHGLGVASFPDGSKYEGEWSQGGHMHGLGKYTWKDGSSYSGEWHLGTMQGCGAWSQKPGQTSSVGSAVEGQFISGEFVGPGLACPVDTARFVAREAEDFARRARMFEAKP